jgi:hypothetical protein
MGKTTTRGISPRTMRFGISYVFVGCGKGLQLENWHIRIHRHGVNLLGWLSTGCAEMIAPVVA